MTTNQERKDWSTYFEIETNERTTWVNLGGRTVARICPVSAEVFSVEQDGMGSLVFMGQPMRTFERFRQTVLERFSIKVPIDARPTVMAFKMGKMRKVACGEVS